MFIAAVHIYIAITANKEEYIMNNSNANYDKQEIIMMTNENKLLKQYSFCGCKTSHNSMIECELFKKVPTVKRREMAKKANCCVNCLKVGHWQLNCNSSARCRVCRKQHNTMLHEDEPNQYQTDRNSVKNVKRTMTGNNNKIFKNAKLTQVDFDEEDELNTVDQQYLLPNNDSLTTANTILKDNVVMMTLIHIPAYKLPIVTANAKINDIPCQMITVLLDTGASYHFVTRSIVNCTYLYININNSCYVIRHNGKIFLCAYPKLGFSRQNHLSTKLYIQTQLIVS